MITVIHEQRTAALPDARADRDGLWLDAAEVERASGWQWKPEGLCHGDTCVPLPRGADVVRDGRIDLAAMWRHMDQPVVHDEAGGTWVLGTGAAQRSETLTSLQAPDFALPDLDGRVHRLSDYRGRRVFLATWSSW